MLLESSCASQAMSPRISSMNSSLTWWAASPGTREEFGAGCLAIGNLDNSPSAEPKLAVASYSGMLRLYAPKAEGWSVDDLLLEVSLGAAVLQLEAAPFLGGRMALASLHPRSLAIHSLSPGPGGGFALSKACEYPLQRPACNFTYGSFGGASGRTRICVQSMDG